MFVCVARLRFDIPAATSLKDKRQVVRRVIECDARRVVYVSCNPTTLAPNASQLEAAGYRLSRVTPMALIASSLLFFSVPGSHSKVTSRASSHDQCRRI